MSPTLYSTYHQPASLPQVLLASVADVESVWFLQSYTRQFLNKNANTIKRLQREDKAAEFF